MSLSTINNHDPEGDDDDLDLDTYHDHEDDGNYHGTVRGARADYDDDDLEDDEDDL